jgi:hypothetical protein
MSCPVRLFPVLLLAALLLAVAAPARAAADDDVVTDEEFHGPFSTWRDVKAHYGAVGDGVADDTAAIQAALNDLRTVSTNPWAVLYFPAGTYRITSTLTTARSAHNDYLGAEIVGEDPLTTRLRWDGPSGGAMLRLDAWFNKLSRLTFDGAGRAGQGLARSGGFATWGELSDLQFLDLGVGINLGEGLANGIAEQAILRCRFYRNDQGIVVWNYNSLDIYIWHSYFEDCGEAVYCATGAFHAYQNRFVRSTRADLRAAAMIGSIVDNVSHDSASFLGGTGEGSLHLQRNRIYLPRSGAIGDARRLVTIDNLVVDPAGRVALTLSGGNRLLVGDTYATPNPWPIQPARRPFNHGQGADAVNGRPVANAVDGNPSTHAVVGMWQSVAGFQWTLPPGTQRAVHRYALTAPPAGASYGEPGRDPTHFALLGSNDWGATWTTLDTRTGITFTRGQRREFTLASPANHALYALRVLRTIDGSTPANGGFAALAEWELLDAAGADIIADSGGIVHGADESWHPSVIQDLGVRPPTDFTPPPAPGPYAFAPRVSRAVFTPSALTGAAIQQAINLAAAQPAGSRPVVHLPKGQYSVASTLVIPADLPLTVVGDGGHEHGTRLVWTGSAGAGPLLRLAGPSRATLRDLQISGGAGSNGVDAIHIEDADQAGGRIFLDQVMTGGHAIGATAELGVLLQGLEHTDVLSRAYGLNGVHHGVRAVGGNTLAARGLAPGRAAFFTGAASFGSRLFDVRQGARLAAAGLWYESYLGPQAPLLEFGPASSGDFAIAGFLTFVVRPGVPIFRTHEFDGRFSFLATTVDHRPVSFLEYTGQAATRVLGAANDYFLPEDPAGYDKTPADLWRDSTGPAARIAHLLSTYGTGYQIDFPSSLDGVVGARPDAAFIREQLAVLRELPLDLPARAAEPAPPGVTDLRLVRVIALSRGGTVTLRALGAPAPAPVTLTLAPIPDQILPHHRPLDLRARAHGPDPLAHVSSGRSSRAPRPPRFGGATASTSASSRAFPASTASASSSPTAPAAAPPARCG